MKILIVDDSQSERLFLNRYLSKQGHEIVTAENGAEGVAKYEASLPDLVLLDMMMPDMDGREAVRRMRALSDEWVPIIFLSGLDATEDIETALDSGGDDYLVKPFQPKILGAKIRSMSRIAAMRARLVEANAKLTSLAEMDGLTGIANRRRLDAKLKEELLRCARAKLPLSLILMDIDHFKKFNDTYGHLTGDECLKLVAGCVAAEVRRPADLIARYGGEEFCAVLPETPLEGALALAEQMRKSVEALALQTTQGPVNLTISLGLTTIVPTHGNEPASLLEAADGALYKSKQAGRNRATAA
jgi:diguanylate cyclase (GGDEF)-like protein